MTTHDITTLDQLRELYREPSERVKAKKGLTIDGATATFVAQSTFLCLATSNGEGGCDVSPRGGPAGQLKVLNEGRSVALPDLSGNNLIDSLSNIVANPHAGVLAMVTGSDETLRIDGPARLTTDPEILSLWSDELKRIKVAIVIDISSVFMHCAKAFRRGGVWQPDSWLAPDELLACQMFNDISGTEVLPAAEMRRFLEADYDQSLADERV